MAFEKLKQYLGQVPLVMKTLAGEKLLLYLSATDEAISTVVVCNEDKIQRPIYFISKVLHDAELRYPNIEKLAFALGMAARKLRPYFQDHLVSVVTDQPLR